VHTDLKKKTRHYSAASNSRNVR